MSLFISFNTRSLAEPYRIFFPFGWFMALWGTGYWVAAPFGVLNEISPVQHGAIQIQLFCFAFAVGFLLTALPKFLRTRTATKMEVAIILFAFVVGACFILFGFLALAQIVFAFLTLAVGRFGWLRFKERGSLPPDQFLLIYFGLFNGLIGILISLFAPSHLLPIGIRLQEQGIFIPLALGVGTFLGPRLMGIVDTSNAVVSLARKPGINRNEERSRLYVISALGALITMSFFIEGLIYHPVGTLLRGVTAGGCLFWFGMGRAPKTPSPVGWLVCFALWCVVGGQLLSCLLPTYEIGALHLTYIGGFAGLILAIGAQVMSSHGGVPTFWKEHRSGVLITAILVIAALVVRFAASFAAARYLHWNAAAALLLLAALLLWGIALLPLRHRAKEQ